jgi:hypothetical protein
MCSILVLVTLIERCSLASAYSYYMLQSCSTSLTTGTKIMGSSASSGSETVSLKRSDGTILTSGGNFWPGETLTVTLSNVNQLRSDGYVYQVSGAVFTGRTTGCGSTRSTSSNPTVTMPSSGTVSIWAGYAYGQSTVYITSQVTLTEAHTQFPTATPVQNPTLKPTQPTCAPSPAPT